MKPTLPIRYNVFDEKGKFVISFLTNGKGVNTDATLILTIGDVDRKFTITEKEEIPNLVNRIFDLTVVEHYDCDFV